MRPERRRVLEQTYRVREGIDPHRHASFGRHVFRVPEQDFYVLLYFFPNLNSTDPFLKSAAWEAFERDPMSEPYRVGKVVKGVTRNGSLVK